MLVCNCPFTMRVMAKRGAPHATRMLASGKPESLWSPNDLIEHFGEEPRYFFPLLPRFIARRLAADHVVFIRELREYGKIVSVVRFKQHAAIENTYAKDLLERMAA